VDALLDDGIVEVLKVTHGRDRINTINRIGEGEVVVAELLRHARCQLQFAA
jgi:hypothetical protein